MKGFTLVEILVVLAVVGILSVTGYINYRTFSHEQIIDDAVSSVQSLLRTAQTNATTSLKCKTVGSQQWIIAFKNKSLLELQCIRADNSQLEPIKTLNLTNNVELDSISGVFCSSTFPTNIITLSFDTLSGKVGFFDPGQTCIAALDEIAVVLKHQRTEIPLLKTITVGKGGGINAQN